MKSYYVYEHWLDNQCFYVGKGTYGSLWGGKERYEQFQDDRRNKEWKDFVDGKYNEIKIRIVKNFDNEKEALDYEEKLADKRELEGNPLTCIRYGNRGLFGEQNGMYGKTGDKNPMYNKGYLFEGEKNPMFNKKHTEETINKMKKNHNDVSGVNNPRVRKVLLININGDIIKEFDMVKDCIFGKWRKEFPLPNGSDYVRKCLKEGLLFHDCYLKYEEKYLEELKNEKDL